MWIYIRGNMLYLVFLVKVLKLVLHSLLKLPKVTSGDPSALEHLPVTLVLHLVNKTNNIIGCYVALWDNKHF